MYTPGITITSSSIHTPSERVTNWLIDAVVEIEQESCTEANLEIPLLIAGFALNNFVHFAYSK